jgi:hypothetical protein
MPSSRVRFFCSPAPFGRCARLQLTTEGGRRVARCGTRWLATSRWQASLRVNSFRNGGRQRHFLSNFGEALDWRFAVIFYMIIII